MVSYNIGMTLEEICKSKSATRYATLLKYRLLDELKNKTSFLDEEYERVSYGQRIWHVEHDVYDIQHCPYCNRPMNYNINAGGYRLCKDCKYKKIKETKIKENSYVKSAETTKKRNQEKYGVDWYYQTDEFKQKAKKTCLEKYGVEYHQQSNSSKQKIKESVQKTYKENAETIKSKVINTNKTRYGTEWYQQTDEYKSRAKETNLERYGVEHASMLPEIQQKAKKTLQQHYSDHSIITEKIKETSREKYGTDWYQYSELFKSRSKDQAQRILGKKYEVLEVNGRDWTVKHKSCGKVFNTTAAVYYGRCTRSRIELCPHCYPYMENSSSSEKMLLDFIKSIYKGEIIENTKSVISPYELDIYLPEKNIAIEYNGLYWHSEKYVSSTYHKMKSDMCKEKGIHLMHVFEDDWMYKREIIQSVIKNFLGCGHQTIVYARKCEVREVNNSDTQAFLQENHMLGKMMMISHSIGLYYEGSLVSLMAFRCTSKEKKIIELSRYAIKRDYNIKGGAERIFKHFLKMYGSLYDKVKTFNDNGVFKGTVHYRLGFVHTGTNDPNYMYYDKKLGIRVSKQSLRKIRKSYKVQEEFEEKDRYYRVYNAGNDTCEYIIRHE